MISIEDKFAEAVVASKQLAARPSNDVLLKLYSLYKQATEGDAGEDTSAGFDLVGKAKYNAWSELKGKPRTEAMEAYVQLVNSLK